MQILRLGQKPEDMADYQAIEIAPEQYITWDHLSGFNNDLRSIVLDMFDSGIVHTEYIFSDEIRNRYSHLDLRFDATMMIHNNHLDTYHHFTPHDIPPKTIKNFLSTFNKSQSSTKSNFLLMAFDNQWIDTNHSSKFYQINMVDARSFFEYISRPLPANLDKFCDERWNFEWAGNGNAKLDLTVLGPKIQDSFIHVVTETIGDSSLPFPTEKFVLPNINKTLWIGYAPRYYHQYIEKYFGFKKYQHIDYEFDTIKEPIQRLMAMESMLKSLAKLSLEEKLQIYADNQEIIEHNYNLIRTGEFIENIKRLDQATPDIKAYRQRRVKQRRYRQFMDIVGNTVTVDETHCGRCPLKNVHSLK